MSRSFLKSLATATKSTALKSAGVWTGAAVAGGMTWWAWRTFSPKLRLAPGWPGKAPRWSSSAKQGVGTSIDPRATLWFTLCQGVVTEVFYPSVDRPAIRQMSLIVTGPDGFHSDEKCDANHEVQFLSDGAPLYRVLSICQRGRYKMEKIVFGHPSSPVLVMRIRFTPLAGNAEDYRLHVLVDPHLGNHGWHNRAWTASYKGSEMLMAAEGEHALAMGCSAGWRKRSVGFHGVSDGSQQLKRYGRLRQTYRLALPGHVGLAGEIDHAGSRSDECVLALGFGADADEAGYRVRQSLLADIDGLQDEYVNEWCAWQAGFKPPAPQEVRDRDLFRTSTMVLRTHEDKHVPGAFVASLSIPWGEARKTRGHFGPVGYHVVWTRDLGMIAGGLLAAGDGGAAQRALEYCQACQEAEGRWPQNQTVCGRPLWKGRQLDETSQSLLLLNLANQAGLLSAKDRRRFWPMAKAAASHLLRMGPSAQEDRWENARGFTPFTLSSAIAALVVAAELAAEQGESALAALMLEMADAWHASIDEWTYVRDTPLARKAGVEGYYMRIAPPDAAGQPVKYHGRSELWYRPSRDQDRPPEEIISVDALAYVRFGLRAPDDPRIINTVKAIDAELRTETPFGPCWHRYSCDGYGEQPDGSPFDGRRGVGRLWPLLTGERAHYELSAGRAETARRLLETMERLASDEKLLPEQVWDAADMPARGLYSGRATGAAMPLAWAHAEYLKLRRSLAEGKVYDLPRQVRQRYVVDKPDSQIAVWRVNHRRGQMPPGKRLRIVCDEPARLSWSAGNTRDWQTAETRHAGLGIHCVDLPASDLPEGSVVRFRFDAPQTKRVAKDERYFSQGGEVHIRSSEPKALVAASSSA
ncbi:MAG TPA: glycoside hydrolase family 15 protein [Pirellulales bacterium]|nr:glycoside hydrolase family 15 protein [Pirellulales bacterium]